jgi:hypothetical protein
MISKYIGSAVEFMNSKYAMMVYSDTLLVKDNIYQYTSKTLPISVTVETEIDKSQVDPITGDPLNNRAAVFTKSDIDKFKSTYRSIKGDNSNPSFNYIILLDVYGDPVGFINPIQDVEFDKYKIETVTIILNFKLKLNDNVYVNLDLDTSYIKHISDTVNGNSHIDRLQEGGSFKVLTKNEIINKSITNKVEYISTPQEIEQLPNTIYHYSGKFHIGKNKIDVSRFIIDYSSINDSLFYDILKYKYNNELYHFLFIFKSYETIVYIYDKSFKLRYDPIILNNLIIDSILEFGSNIIIGYDTQSSRKIYDTSIILDYLLESPSASAIPNGLEVYYDQNYKFRSCRNPITKEIYLYHIDSNHIITGSNKLLSLLGQFDLIDNSNRYNFGPDNHIFYASDNLVCTGTVNKNDLYHNFIESLSIYNPWSMQYGVNNVYNISNTDNLFDIKGVDVSDIAFLSPTLLYIEDYSKTADGNTDTVNYKYIDSLMTESKYGDPMKYKDSNTDVPGNIMYDNRVGNLLDNNDINRSLIEMPLDNKSIRKFRLSNNGCRNYHRIAKVIDAELRQLTPMRLTSDGNLFGYRIEGDNIIIRKL